jgi:uncharacterized protein (TIGR03083 family)
MFRGFMPSRPVSAGSARPTSPARPTADWSVAQVLSHLGSGAEIALTQLQAARTGTTPPGPGHFRAVWARWDARPPRQQAAAFAEAVPRLHDAIEALDDAGRRELRPHFHAGPVDLPVFLAFRLAEQALHAWDVHVPFEPAAAVDAGAVGLLAELLPFGASMADAEVLGALAPARLTVVTSDPARRFVLDLGAQARLCPADDGEVSGSLRLPAEALIRLVTGRLDPAHTPRGPLPRAGRPWMPCGGCTADTDPRRHPATETAGRNLSAEHAPAPEAAQQWQQAAWSGRYRAGCRAAGFDDAHPARVGHDRAYLPARPVQ